MLKRIMLGLLIMSPLCNVNAASGPQTTQEYLDFFEEKIPAQLETLSLDDLAYGLYLQGKVFKIGGEEIKFAATSNPKADLVKFHRDIYCSQDISLEKTALSCKADYGPNSKQMALAHLKADTLLTPLVYSQQADINAQLLMRNVIDPFPSSTFRSKFSTTGSKDPLADNTTRNEYADTLAKQAVINLARYSLNQIYLSRVPTEGFDNYSIAPTDSSKSMLSIMEAESTKWVKEDFSDLVKYPTDIEVTRAVAKMQAFEMWMRYQQYRQTERMEALMAVLVAKSVNGSAGQILDKLNEQTSAAANMLPK